tara:strand:+ start:453 stop:635 length:183 start_codon:yes stop_codon:yes gene_type:complete
MVTFARARTKSFLAMLWPIQVQSNNENTDDIGRSNELLKKHAEQKRRFLEVSKNGGMWFS